MKTTRKQAIVSYVNAHIYASFSDLCKEFGVSPATMRRDLTELGNEGLINRVHGGARTTVKLEEVDTSIAKRLKLAVDEKATIAKYAFSLIEDGDSIILDSSTTMYPLAKLISYSDLHLTVITNNIDISRMLSACENIDMYLLGGIILHKYSSTFGPFSEKMLRSIEADKYFISADYISIDDGLFNTHYDIIPFKTIALEKSKIHYALIDSTKFSSKSFLHVCDLDEIDTIITDNNLSDDIYKQYKKKGINIIKAE